MNEFFVLLAIGFAFQSIIACAVWRAASGPESAFGLLDWVLFVVLPPYFWWRIWRINSLDQRCKRPVSGLIFWIGTLASSLVALSSLSLFVWGWIYVMIGPALLFTNHILFLLIKLKQRLRM